MIGGVAKTGSRLVVFVLTALDHRHLTRELQVYLQMVSLPY